MKTYTGSHHPESTLTAAASAAPFLGLGRTLMVLLLSLAFSFGTAATTLAAGADGAYKFVRGSGKISVAGESLDIPTSLVQQIGGVVNGRVTIKNNRIQINRNAGAAVVDYVGEMFGVTFNYTVGGSKFIDLKKSGRLFTGKTVKPVVVKFSADYMGMQVTGNIRSAITATVKGRTLTLKVPVSGSAMGFPIKGNMTVVCQRR
jgi:hypothetical protein